MCRRFWAKKASLHHCNVSPLIQSERTTLMKRHISLIFSLASLFIFPLLTRAQEIDEMPLEPKTRLEVFEARGGVVVIKGFSRIGVAAGSDGSSIEVETRELRDAESGSKEYGITIEVRDAGKPERRRLSFIDYDEMEPLLKGLEYLSRIDNSVTRLNRFEADYRTRGDLVVSAFSGRGGNVSLSITSGVFRKVYALFKLEDLKVIRGLIIEAKNQLDAIRQK